MCDLNKLHEERNAAASALEDTEFEQFAVSLGCAPQRLRTINEEVKSQRRHLGTIDSAIEAEQFRLREQERARTERRSRRLKLDDVDVEIAFADLVFHLRR